MRDDPRNPCVIAGLHSDNAATRSVRRPTFETFGVIGAWPWLAGFLLNRAVPDAAVRET